MILDELAALRVPWAVLALSAGLGAASCGSARQVTAPPPPPAPPALAHDGPGGGHAVGGDRELAKPPQLLVAVVYDQLGSDTLLRSLGALEPEGAIRNALRRGVYFERGTYPYINTLTAPGHAAIFTGASPRISGIGGNEEWDEAAGMALAAVESAGHRVLGDELRTAAPTRLRVPTLGEVLLRETGGRARVVAVSLKDRAAVLSAGRGPDAALWFDATLGRFTSSTYYGKTLPAWLEPWQRQHPIAEALRVWEPLGDYTALLGPDDAVGERNFWGATFPHDPKTTPQPLKTARMSPALSEALVQLAQAATRAYRLGEDEIADLLVVSVSGTDYVGHVYGPHSWEYIDHLRRADLAVGRWLSQLSKTCSLSVMLTSDHGVAPLPEHALADGHDAGRLFREELRAHLETALDRRFGAQDWIAAQIDGFIYFTPLAEARADFAAVLETAQSTLKALPGVRNVFSAREAASWVGHADPRLAAAAESFPEGGPADLLIDTHKYWIFGFGAPPGTGTHHGSRNDYDQQVPILFYGHGVGQGRVRESVNQLRVAPTMAALLGVSAPTGATLPALPVEN